MFDVIVALGEQITHFEKVIEGLRMANERLIAEINIKIKEGKRLCNELNNSHELDDSYPAYAAQVEFEAWEQVKAWIIEKTN